jgi:hypothetical protein
VGCNPDTEVSGVVVLTAANAAAFGGLTFAFSEATIFGFPGESATLGLGDAGTTFTLTTSGGTVINGTLTLGSCRLVQNSQEVGEGEAPFDEEYETCEATVASEGAIDFGDSGAGTVTLRLGRTGETPVASAPEDVTFHVDTDGTVTINNNNTPI